MIHPSGLGAQNTSQLGSRLKSILMSGQTIGSLVFCQYVVLLPQCACAQLMFLGQVLKCGVDYSPSTYTLALKKYDGATSRASHHRTYTLAAGTTIGALIDTIVNKNMHHFLFLLYTDDDRFKGCGHHLCVLFLLFLILLP